MISRILISLILLSFSLSTLAQEDLSGRFVPQDGEITVEPGDIFKATIQLMPHAGRTDYSRYKKEEGKPFLNFFYLIKVDEISPSPNNGDVLEISGSFALRKHFGGRGLYIWSIEDENIPIEVRGIVSKDIKDKKPKQLLVANQKYSSDFKINYFLIACIFVALVALGAIGGKLYLKKREKRLASEAVQKEIRAWNERFENAQTREDFESIYSERSIWLSFLGVETPQINMFFKVINSKQYQKEWCERELYDVTTAFDDIREIMKSKHGI